MTGAWKNGQYGSPDYEAPCAIVPGGFYTMRNGGSAFVEECYSIPFAYNGQPRAWYGWRGYVLADGSRCSWDLDGAYSPAVTHEMDLVEALA